MPRPQYAGRIHAYVFLALMLVGRFVLPGAHPTATATGFTTFGDEDRSAELAAEVVYQRYQFNTPTTVTYDQDTLTSNPATARIYVADVGNYKIRVFDLFGRQIGQLDDQDTLRAADSPATSTPQIKAPLGIYFLSKAEALDDRLAGLYVNDIGSHRVHFYRTDSSNPDTFYYVNSFGQEGSGGGTDLKLPRNLVVTPSGFAYVSDEFNHRVKGFRFDPNTYTAQLVTTLGWTDASGNYVPAGPIIRGVDKNYGTDSMMYDDYVGAPDKLHGFRIPQGLTYWRSPDGTREYLFVCDNGNNRIKIYEINQSSGALTLVDMLGYFKSGSSADHLKRPRGVRTDRRGNLYVADTFNGRILKFPNLASSGSGTVSYRASLSSDATVSWAYGRLGIHQVEMRTPATALTEDAAFQLPNDIVPLQTASGTWYTEDVWAWGTFYSGAPVVLVSDSGNHRIKKCWIAPDHSRILRCSVSETVGGAPHHEFWGHPRTLSGQLHAVGGMRLLPSTGTQSNVLLVSDTPNTRINMYGSTGQYLGLFSGSTIGYGVTGLDVYQPTVGGNPYEVGVLVASDASLPYPYTGDSSLRIYDEAGSYDSVYNLTYRTSGRSVPAIAFTNDNYPVAVDIRLENSSNAIFGVYITSHLGYVWKFAYNRSARTLSVAWVKGGPDTTKGSDSGANWSLGVNFFKEGAAGTFDQIQDVVAHGDRVYVVDRRNQRIQVLNSSTGAYIGKIGRGGGTYDHPASINATEFFLPVGVDYDAANGDLLVGDGFNMIARAYDNPAASVPDSTGQIKPPFLGYWLDPHLGTRPGGLFSAEHVTSGNGKIFINALISNRVTAFDYNARTPAP